MGRLSDRVFVNAFVVFVNDLLAFPSTSKVGPKDHVPVPLFLEELLIVVHICGQREHP